jgi:hypothetical protein
LGGASKQKSVGWCGFSRGEVTAGEKIFCLAGKLSQHLLTLVDLHSYYSLDSKINISLFEEVHKLQVYKIDFGV